MSSTNIAILVAAFFVFEAIIVTGILSLAASEVKSLAKHFPPVEPRAGAESRWFQSFALGFFNFGWCFHVVADAEYVHMRPVWMLRRFGVTGFSIPRAELTKPRRVFGGVKVTVRGETLRGPRWCLAPDLR